LIRAPVFYFPAKSQLLTPDSFKKKAPQVAYASRIPNQPDSLSEGTYSECQLSCENRPTFQMSYSESWVVTITIASITWSIFNIAHILMAVKDIFTLRKAV
jgi:hypothetical protein